MIRRYLLGGFAALGAIAFAGAAAAVPLAKTDLAMPGDGAALVLKVHGCHFDMGPGMAPDYQNGPHYHDRQCRVVRTGPPAGAYRQRGYYEEPRRPGPGPYVEHALPYRGGYGPLPPPPPVCVDRCKYVGPFKRCRTVCQ